MSNTIILFDLVDPILTESRQSRAFFTGQLGNTDKLMSLTNVKAFYTSEKRKYARDSIYGYYYFIDVKFVPLLKCNDCKFHKLVCKFNFEVTIISPSKVKSVIDFKLLGKLEPFFNLHSRESIERERNFLTVIKI